jgi:hypothetical protein
MSTAYELFEGDCTFATHFNKVLRSDCGAEVTAGFKAPRGREFVVLLLGDVEAGQGCVDVDKMLNELGYFKRDEAAGDGASD